MGFPGFPAQNVGDLLRRQAIGKQALDLACVAEQVGSSGEIGCEFVDQSIQSCRWDGAKPGRGPRHGLQIRLIELLEEPSGGGLAHHQEQGRGFFRPGERSLAADRCLKHGRSPAEPSSAV
jgi:hypothetical protein